MLMVQASRARTTPGPGVPLVLAEEERSAITNLALRAALHDSGGAGDTGHRPRHDPLRLEGSVTAAGTRFRRAAGCDHRRDAQRPRREAGVRGRSSRRLRRRICAPEPTRSRWSSAAPMRPLNRSAEFLYALFVPARARQAFPCFDQPDLKARCTLALDVPAAWQALSNGAEVTRATRAARSTMLRFARDPADLDLSLHVRRRPVQGRNRGAQRPHVPDAPSRDRRREGGAEPRRDLRPARRRPRLARRTTPASPIRSASSTSCWCRRSSSAAWSIRARSSTTPQRLLLDESATQNQKLGRASLIAHETAHMWFGDLVTMRWFNDVWMKEVFANFMAAKIVNPAFPEINHDLRFLYAHYPAAYDVDRTAGTNAIRQPLDNLNEAGSCTARSSIRRRRSSCASWRRCSARRRFRDGLREYLKAHAFGNATWPDLIAMLDRPHARGSRRRGAGVGRGSRAPDDQQWT